VYINDHERLACEAQCWSQRGPCSHDSAPLASFPLRPTPRPVQLTSVTHKQI